MTLTTQTSSLFLRNVTCIDHAFITDDGLIQGGSFHPQITVTGNVEENEQVVVDFSKVKNQIKNYIDDKLDGFDHKLWIVEDHSNCEVFYESENHLYIRTDKIDLKIPSNAVKFVYNEDRHLEFRKIVEKAMERELETHLRYVNNNENIRVQLELTETVFGSKANRFTYWHGLKNSTSWGCKNIAHGHTSFVECYNADGIRVGEMERMIAHYLNGSLLINKDNIKEGNTIGYETSRGKFELNFSNEVKHIIMETETTIENIIEHVDEVFHASLDYYRIEKMLISEGLQKGAMKKRNV